MLQAFERKPLAVRADRFDGTLESADRLAAAVPGVELEMRVGGPGPDREWTGRLRVKGLAGVEKAGPDDYIVVEGRDVHVMDPDEFEAQFLAAS